MFEEEMRKANARKNVLRELVNLMVETTGESEIKWMQRQMTFSDLLTNINPRCNISNRQYDELINLLDQFEEIVRNYLKENNIVIKEED